MKFDIKTPTEYASFQAQMFNDFLDNVAVSGDGVHAAFKVEQKRLEAANTTVRIPSGSYGRLNG
jgi:hypothetical protein